MCYPLLKEVKVPRVNIYLSAEIKERLAEYLEREWGGHHSLSAIVQKAIKEFLDREEEKGKKTEG